jgi:hypothetical protein
MGETRELTAGAEDVIAWRPCSRWPHKAIRKLIGRKRWSALQILRASKGVSVEDRLWLVLREELVPAQILHEFACRCAEKALQLFAKCDRKSVRAIAAKRQWRVGRISTEALAAAEADAWDAAWVVTGAGPRLAARAAAAAAAVDAVGAAEAASLAASWAATSWHAERWRQAAMLSRLLGRSW